MPITNITLLWGHVMLYKKSTTSVTKMLDHNKFEVYIKLGKYVKLIDL